MKEKSLQEKINYLFKKTNWGASFFDADAIKFMNEIALDIKELEKYKKFHKHIKSHFEKEHPELDVCCKICDKTFKEIVDEEKKEPIEFWINVYGNSIFVAHKTKEDADNFSSSSRKGCIHVREVIDEEKEK